MAAHLAPKDRVQRWAFLVMALGIGLAAFALASGGQGPSTVDADKRGATTDPTVLGVVVTRDAADPAAPATFDLPAGEEPRDDQPAQRTATTAPRRATTSTTSTPGPTLIPPTVVDNTTTTSTTDATTSTTAG